MAANSKIAHISSGMGCVSVKESGGAFYLLLSQVEVLRTFVFDELLIFQCLCYVFISSLSKIWRHMIPERKNSKENSGKI